MLNLLLKLSPELTDPALREPAVQHFLSTINLTDDSLYSSKEIVEITHMASKIILLCQGVFGATEDQFIDVVQQCVELDTLHQRLYEIVLTASQRSADRHNAGL